MKISVLTLHAVINYGSALQSYATQKIFEDLGLETEIVDYRREPVLESSLPLSKKIAKASGVAGKIKTILLHPSSKKGRKVFDSFLDSHINQTPQRYTYDEDFEKYPIESDIFCTGSDQVWNSGWHNGTPRPFYLSFVPEGKKKIAFSASFGKQELEDWEKSEVTELLSSYDAISIRETSGVDIVKNLEIENAVHILDPTMVLEPKYWYELSEERLVKEKYVLVYQLCNNTEFDKYAVKFSKEKGLKLIRMCIRYDQIRKPGHGIVLPPVEGFLSLIRHAEYVLTDSFHCTAFSLTFHKQFVDFYPSAYGSRLESVVKMVGLEERLITDYSNFEIADKTIDYESVDGIISIKRAEGMNFLKNAVE